MFNRELIDELRATIERQQLELAALRAENRKLVDRLLLRSGVQPITERDDSQSAIEKLLASQNIFGDDEIDTGDDTITDNRKERDDAFAS